MKTNLVSLLCTAALLAGGVPFAGAADIVTAIPTREMGQTVYVNDTRVTPTGYNIADNNYFKLRDIAALVGFGVEWDQDTQTVELSSERTTGSLNGITDSSVSGTAAKVSGQRFALDGYYINMKAYLIGGNNYVKLRDIALQINFGVSYDNESGRVTIYPGLFYGEEPAGSTISLGSGSNVTEEMLRTWELQMVDRINEERRNAGVPELVLDDDLMWSSRFWAEHLTSDFRHAVYGEITDLAKAQGIEVRPDIDNVVNGENITGAGRLTGIGYDPMTLSMNNFMASEGHRNAILNPEFTRVGVGFAVAEDGNIYCCQHFGR